MLLMNISGFSCTLHGRKLRTVFIPQVRTIYLSIYLFIYLFNYLSIHLLNKWRFSSICHMY